MGFFDVAGEGDGPREQWPLPYFILVTGKKDKKLKLLVTLA